jgi:hypothetical protein
VVCDYVIVQEIKEREVSRYRKEEDRAVPKWMIMPNLNHDDKEFKRLVASGELVETIGRRGTKLYSHESAVVGRSVVDRGSI